MMWVDIVRVIPRLENMLITKTIRHVTLSTERKGGGDYCHFVCVIAALLLLLTCKVAWGADALDRQISLDIPFNMSLEDALVEWGAKAGMTVMMNTRTVDGHTTRRIKGTFNARKALRLLLENSGLSYVEGETTIRVVPADMVSRMGLVESEAPLLSVSSDEVPKELDSGDNDSERARTLEEVVVTAQKRSENVLDVPIPITVLTGKQLESQNVTSLADLASYVPGLSISSFGSPGQREIVLRGLAVSTDQSGSAPLVATYIDDVPVGATTGERGSEYGVDLMPYDLDRIEVLRGPQGTLYGADAMGGIIKYSLRQPDLDHFDLRVGGDLENVEGAGNIGGMSRAAVNIPIINDVLAARISGFYKSNPGFIDNVGTGARDSNSSKESGGRATVLWKATDRLTLQATVLAQDIHVDDVTEVSFDAATRQPVYGADAQFTYWPQTFEQQFRLYALHIDWDLNFATLTSSTSWSHMSSAKNFDLSAGEYTYPIPSITNFIIDDELNKFTEEARLASPDNQRISWMLGILYTREAGNEPEYFPAYALPASTPVPTSTYVPLPPPLNNLITQNDPGVFAERAVFGNATYKLNSSFDFSAGARYAEYADHSILNDYGFFDNPPAINRYSTQPYIGKTTWMGNARFHLNPEAMIYARVATGYRPGGGCTGCGNAVEHTPDFYYSDSIVNYEVGFKGEFLDRRLQLDTSLFDIDWKNIQLVVANGGFPYLGNGAGAVSRGAELSLSYVMTANLRLQATAGYTDAHLTADAPNEGGASGNQLPLSARWTASVSADYRRPIDERKSLSFGGSYRYRDKIVNQFAGSAQIPGFAGGTLPMPPQNIVNLYTGLTIAQIALRLYATNAFNNRSYTGAPFLVDPTKPWFVPIQPRTIGLSVDYQF